MNFFSIVIAILALSLTSVVCDTGTEPDNFVPNLNLQKELQDIRNQIYHESTIRLQFDKELSSMARRYRTLIVDQTNAKIENNKTKTTLSKLEQSVQNLQQNTTEKLNKFETVVTSFALDFQAIKNSMNDSSKKVNNLEAAFHDLQRNFTASKLKLDAVSQILQETINAMNEQFTELNSSIVENQSAKERYLRDCGDVETNSPDGVYRIHPTLNNSVEAYCKISSGKWTVFQRRMNGQTDFYRGWSDYSGGFGNPNTEYWLGNKYIHELTASRSCSLRIEMTDWNNNVGYAEYSTFRVDSETDGFKLHVRGFSGDKQIFECVEETDDKTDVDRTWLHVPSMTPGPPAVTLIIGDGLKRHDGHKFTTKDRDQDTNPGNCALKRSGAWWYTTCTDSNLNGDYSVRSGLRGVFWKRTSLTMKKTEMMLRCK